MKQNVAVIGAGSWGTALAITLSGKNHHVKIWDLDEKLVKDLDNDRENKKYLPGINFNDSMSVAYDVKDAIYGADIVLFSVPAQFFRSALTNAKQYINSDMIIVNVAKGIEQKTLMTMSQVADEIIPENQYVVLSGPSHAEEVGKGIPTTVAVASKDITVAEHIQDVFMTDRFRVYTNHDVVGLELGGSLKNIIALGAGITDGMGFGDNTKAAMMTRGISEMVTLGIAMGAEKDTFSGLSGIGDLIVTCTSMHSRNRRCGILIGEGMDPQEATGKIGMVVEGMFTTEAAYELAKKMNVSMPITEQIYNVINGKVSPEDAMDSLMTRPKKHEMEHIE